MKLQTLLDTLRELETDNADHVPVFNRLRGLRETLQDEGVQPDFAPLFTNVAAKAVPEPYRSTMPDPWDPWEHTNDEQPPTDEEITAMHDDYQRSQVLRGTQKGTPCA